MKWHPIVDGNLEELDPKKIYLFSYKLIDCFRGHIGDEVDFGRYEKGNGIYLFVQDDYIPAAECTAWMEVPEPYELHGVHEWFCKEEKLTNADRIRLMDDDELVDLLEWGRVGFTSVPGCDEGCEDFGSGCANSCTREKRERCVREWLQSEY